MAVYGESPFPRSGDPSYEWEKHEALPGESLIPDDDAGWYDRWVFTPPEQMTLEIVTNPTVKRAYQEAQLSLGLKSPEVSPEAILTDVVATLSRHRQAAPHGAVKTSTVAWEVFGMSDSAGSGFHWVEIYLRDLSELESQVARHGKGHYRLREVPAEAQRPEPAGDYGPAPSARDVDKMIRKALGRRRRPNRR